MKFARDVLRVLRVLWWCGGGRVRGGGLRVLVLVFWHVPVLVGGS